jgi:hypothetical protein
VPGFAEGLVGLDQEDVALLVVRIDGDQTCQRGHRPRRAPRGERPARESDGRLAKAAAQPLLCHVQPVVELGCCRHAEPRHQVVAVKREDTGGARDSRPSHDHVSAAAKPGDVGGHRQGECAPRGAEASGDEWRPRRTEVGQMPAERREWALRLREQKPGYLVTPNLAIGQRKIRDQRDRLRAKAQGHQAIAVDEHRRPQQTQHGARRRR